MCDQIMEKECWERCSDKSAKNVCYSEWLQRRLLSWALCGRESEWIARYWKQILISFSCCYWFPFHLKLNQSDIRPTHTLLRTIFIELYSTWYTMIYCSQLYFWHFVSPFTLLLRSFLFNMYPVLDPNSINIRWQVWKLSAVINDCKKYHKCSFASFLTPMTPLWESNYLMNKIYMKTPNVLHGL